MAAARPVVGLMLATAASPDTGHAEPARVVEAARLAEVDAATAASVLGPADQGDGYLGQVEQLGGQVLPQLKAFA